MLFIYLFWLINDYLIDTENCLEPDTNLEASADEEEEHDDEEVIVIFITIAKS